MAYRHYGGEGNPGGVELSGAQFVYRAYVYHTAALSIGVRDLTKDFADSTGQVHIEVMDQVQGNRNQLQSWLIKRREQGLDLLN